MHNTHDHSEQDHDTAIEIERMRLAAEMEREREARRERQREQREERRRERDQERERRRQEDRMRRDDEDRRRTKRDAHTQTMLMQVLKEMAGRSTATADPLVAAALAKLGQPDPLVLKLLDTHGKREELTDFFKVQAESMRMASTLQTDSLKQVMLASQDVQAQLIRQAADVAAQRGGGDWYGIGSALTATASIIAALRGQAHQRDGEPLVAPMLTALPGTTATLPSMPVALSAIPRPPSKIGACLHSLRDMQQGKAPDSEDHLRQVVQRLPPSLLAAITQGDTQHLQNVFLPEVHLDEHLAEWLSSPGVGVWLAGCLERIQRVLSPLPQPPATQPPAASSDVDGIV